MGINSETCNAAVLIAAVQISFWQAYLDHLLVPTSIISDRSVQRRIQAEFAKTMYGVLVAVTKTYNFLSVIVARNQLPFELERLRRLSNMTD